MCRFKHYFVKCLSIFLAGVGYVFNAAVFLLAVGCMSTYIYRTTHRYGCAVFLKFLLYGVIGYFLILALQYILVVHFNKYAFHCEGLKKAKRKINVESTIFFSLGIASDVIGRIMIGGYTQTFKGDPWWASVSRTTFLIMILFCLCKVMQEKMIGKLLDKVGEYKGE